MRDLINRKYTVRHLLISFLRDFDVKGIRKLSVLFPKWFLPSPQSVGRYVLTTPDRLKLIIDPSSDSGVELSLHQTGTYEKGILHFIRTHYQANAAFVDVGANIGLMSLFVARKFPESQVIAFEAHPETYNILVNNMKLNGLNNIDTREVAAGESEGVVKIYNTMDDNRGGASIVAYDENANAFDVRQNSLDEELKGVDVEMIKIDVEGFEFQVLSGAREVIKKNKPTLIIEVSEVRTIESNTDEIISFIEDLGFYKIFKLKGTKERKSALIEVKDRTELPQHDNIICLPT